MDTDATERLVTPIRMTAMVTYERLRETGRFHGKLTTQLAISVR